MKHPLVGKHVLVMGLGLHGGGASAAAWLARHRARVTVTDLKSKSELAPTLRQFPISPPDFAWTKSRRAGNFPARLRMDEVQAGGQFPIRFVLGRHRVADFRNADIVVQNPAVPRESRFLKIARAHGAEIENEATLFFKYCKSKNSIGVTGTRGKSTTCAMIAHILNARTKERKNERTRVWLAGNIRTTPMLSIVDRILPNDWVVLELSSWHLENMGEHKISPHIAVVTNVLDDHMNRYQSKRSYVTAKEQIVRHQKLGDIAILNKENSWTRAMGKKTDATVRWFPNARFDHNSLQLPLTLRGRDRSVPPLKIRGGEGALWKENRLFGEHNALNAQAAATAAQACGVSKKIINDALKTFRGLPDRQEIIRVVRGVTYVNDTTATTPDAAIAALQRFGRGRNIVLIAGGTDKNLHYKPLIPWIRKTCTAVVLLPGSATEKIKKLHVTRYTLRVTEVSSMRQAVKTAQTLATHGDVVLLSPAAASFACPPNVRVPQSRSPKGGGIRLVERRGLFQHEFDRGDQFRRAVNAI